MADVVHLARQNTVAALKILISIMEDSNSPATARISAAKELLDRGWGKPTGIVSVAADHARPDEESEHESVLEARRFLAAAEEDDTVGYSSAWTRPR